ncbi:hypothetical protein ACLB2K_021302 [Fragaria x ananassa]
MDVVIGSMTSLNEFRLVTLKLVNMKAGGSEKWKPPTIGTVKINVDGSFFQNTNIGSSGFVVRDSDGRFLAGGGQSYQGVISAEHVEALACKQAVQFAIMYHFVPAVFETDAQGASTATNLGLDGDKPRLRQRLTSTWTATLLDLDDDEARFRQRRSMSSR